MEERKIIRSEIRKALENHTWAKLEATDNNDDSEHADTSYSFVTMLHVSQLARPHNKMESLLITL